MARENSVARARQGIARLWLALALAGVWACGSDNELEIIGELGTPVDALFIRDIPAVATSLGGGGEQWFLVDTGAPFTAIDSDAYAFPDGKRTVSLALFDVELPRQEVVVFDVLPSTTPLPIGGLVGGDILSHLAFTTDRAAAQVWLDGPIEVPGAGPAISVPGDVKGGGRGVVPGSCPRGCGTIDLPASRFIVDARIEDLDRPLRLLVDTGASDVVLTEEIVDLLGSSGARPRLDGVTVSTVVGPIVAYVTRVWELEIGGGARRQSVPVLVLPDPGFFDGLDAEVGEDIDGIVGQGFFRHFVTTVDYPERALHLAPYPDDSHLPPGRYASLGFTLALEGGAWRTASIEPGSDAELQGVSAGEEVTAIAGAATADLDGPAIDELIEQLAPGEPVSVELSRSGQPVALSLEVFDLLPPFFNPGAN